MVDSAIIIDSIEDALPILYKHLKEHKIDICLNNVIFKWLVTLFFENTDESIYLPVMDALLLFGDIILFRASILLFKFNEKEILKCQDICEASLFFDQKLQFFKHKKFINFLLKKEDFNFTSEYINRLRRTKFPKIYDNIQKLAKLEEKNTISNLN